MIIPELYETLFEDVKIWLIRVADLWLICVGNVIIGSSSFKRITSRYSAVSSWDQSWLDWYSCHLKESNQPYTILYPVWF